MPTIDWSVTLPKGYKVAYKICPLADDEILSSVHDAAIYCLMNYDESKGIEFDAYYCTIARLYVLKAIARRKKTSEYVDRAARADLNVYEAIAGLPTPFADIAHDKYVEGLSMRELQEKYNQSVRGMVRMVEDANTLLRGVLS